MAIFSGKVTVKIGAAVGDCETLTNVKLVTWDRVPKPNITPQTVLNTVNPIGWHQGHKYVKGELHVLSEAYHAFYHNGTGNVAYVKEDAENVEIPYFVVTIIDSVGATWTATFTRAIPEGPLEPYKDGEDTVHVYPFYATKVVITPPA